jgi:predicted ribosomally synthesized peptide with nif11-like leader
MSEEQIQALINAVKSDTALQERLKAAPDLDAVVAIAKEAGFVVTKEELKMAQKEATVELSDEELEAVSGGTLPTVDCVLDLFSVCTGCPSTEGLLC